VSARLTKAKPLTEDMERLIRFMSARPDRSVWRHPVERGRASMGHLPAL